MKLKEKKLIFKIAKDVRKKLCYKYAKGYLKDELPSLCYEASESLSKALYKHNIDTFLIQGHVKKGGFHYWLEYKGNIIDLTACQFNRYTRYKFPLILIKPISKLKCHVRENIV